MFERHKVAPCLLQGFGLPPHQLWSYQPHLWHAPYASWYSLLIFLPLSISNPFCLCLSYACRCVAIMVRELKALSAP